MSNTLTREQWDALGVKMSKWHYASFTISIVFAGIMLFMNFWGLSLYNRTPKDQRKGRLTYILVGFVISILFAISSSLDMYTNFEIVWNTTDQSGLRYLSLAQKSEVQWGRITSIACTVAALLVADALLFYRAYILWHDKKWVLALPLLAFLSCVATGIITAGRFDITWQSDSRNRISSAFTFTMRALNIVLTGLIGYKLVTSLQSLSTAFSPKHLRKYDKLTIFLIEAASIPAVLGIVDGVHNALPAPVYQKAQNLNFSYIAFATVFYISAMMAPQLIIFRVTLGRSFTNAADTQPGKWATGTGTINTGGTSSGPMDHSIRFAHTEQGRSEVISDFDSSSGAEEGILAEKSKGYVDGEKQRSA